MSRLDSLIVQAMQAGASDLHLEPGLPPAMRVRGALRILAEPVPARALLGMARAITSDALWATFLERRSLDLSRRIQGVRCRINILQTARGVGMAIRLFSAGVPSLDSLNLHPDLHGLSRRRHGLVLVSGPTGSGKSSTIAALVSAINLSQARHILTIERPIEHELRPRRAYIRQREVGRDTPSFEQALIDAMREDPDVIVVGEMRLPETMRLTLSAAETGHLVFSTIHSSTCAEALHRMIAAFAPEAQASVCAQLADCLVAVVCQRLAWMPRAGIRVPECEILVANAAVRASIRANQLQRLPGIIETGRADGMWSWDRYRRWLDDRSSFTQPPSSSAAAAEVSASERDIAVLDASDDEAPPPLPPPPAVSTSRRRRRADPRPAASAASEEGVIVLDGAGDDPEAILSGLLGGD